MIDASTKNVKTSPIKRIVKKPAFIRFVGNATTYKYYENIMLKNVAYKKK
jgi:hypothetical protein